MTTVLLILMFVPMFILWSDEIMKIIVECIEGDNKANKAKALEYKTKNTLQFEKTVREFQVAMKKSTKNKSDPFDEMDRRIDELLSKNYNKFENVKDIPDIKYPRNLDEDIFAINLRHLGRAFDMLRDPELINIENIMRSIAAFNRNYINTKLYKVTGECSSNIRKILSILDKNRLSDDITKKLEQEYKRYVMYFLEFLFHVEKWNEAVDKYSPYNSNLERIKDNYTSFLYDFFDYNNHMSSNLDEITRIVEEFNITINNFNSQVDEERLEIKINQSLNKTLNEIADLKETLKTPKSETLSKNALDLVRLFEMSKSDIHRKEVMNQLEIIKTALQEDIEAAKLPGTNSYIEEQLAINRRYLSVAKDT